MSKMKQFSVSVQVYVFARDADDAIHKVRSDIEFITDNISDADIVGFLTPTLNDATENTET